MLRSWKLEILSFLGFRLEAKGDFLKSILAKT
jgi:hypothetical protein